ncbi:glycosyltransferase [Acetanaerobacterium elongatum]|uniref:1,2-diacylglycerol 3-alpha-glucosyltransferase n=1 Tax=Acetanaerobacterium elongatum TaxID=258515 RepID=A0A1H0AU67_9FIRM|nr:glycosyltransferase [Acetanaerobacterium elongatum]SDN37012.1 1,2-diacylglycerol 3-alpha-glucosyltransferase [Acetanaerobacterium elongatum]
MKIAIFAETYLPYLNGVVTHISVLKSGLEKLGHEVLIVSADAHAKHHYIENGILHCPAVTSKRIYGYGLASPLSQKRLNMILKFNPDIIHVQTEFGVGLSGIMIAKILRIPLVYTLHTMYDDYIYYVAPSKLVPLVKKLSHGYAKIIAGSVNAITGPSVKIQDYFQSHGVKKPVNIIPNTIEIEKFDPNNFSEEQKKELKQRYNIPDDQMIAIFVGRIGKEKSVDVLLEYWAQTIKPEDGIHLLIVGGGPDSEPLQELAKTLNLDSMVTFTGPVPHEEVASYYAISDVFVTASLSEVYSMTILESMASGLPVLQRFDELISNQIQAGKNGFFFNSATEMASVLRILKRKNPEDMKKMREAVINSVKDSGAESLAKSLLEIYTDLTGKKKYKKATQLRDSINNSKIKLTKLHRVKK